MTSDQFTPDTVITALPVLDSLEGDDGAVLLMSSGDGHRVVRLSLLGALVREQAGSGMPLGQLAAALTALVGPPPTGDPVEVLAGVVSELQGEGIVSVGRMAPTSSVHGSSPPAGSTPASGT